AFSVWMAGGGIKGGYVHGKLEWRASAARRRPAL
ncbi:MAG: DUF1501 domain-containing protein, partial [Planctomycetes bacterium]|nr:DUF1501 domain-containing protein [Planctomycetota bacterium]